MAHKKFHPLARHSIKIRKSPHHHLRMIGAGGSHFTTQNPFEMKQAFQELFHFVKGHKKK